MITITFCLWTVSLNRNDNSFSHVMFFSETLSRSAIHIPVFSFSLARICLYFLFFMFLDCFALGAFLLNSTWLCFSGGADGFVLLFGFGLASPGPFVQFGKSGLLFLALHTQQ